MPVTREKDTGGMGSNPANSPILGHQLRHTPPPHAEPGFPTGMPHRASGTVNSACSPLKHNLVWLELYRGDCKNQVTRMDPNLAYKKKIWT